MTAVLITAMALATIGAVAFVCWLVSRDEDNPPSEFGRGIAVPLVKFSQHLSHHDIWLQRVIHAWRWMEMTDEERLRLSEEAESKPFSDAASFMASMGFAESLLRVDESPEKVISHMLEMWMYGASDHFYELDEEAPPALHDLADLASRMGRSWMNVENIMWGKQDYERLMDTWKEATLQVERMLGVRGANWGEW